MKSGYININTQPTCVRRESAALFTYGAEEDIESLMVGHICEIHLFQQINIHLHWGHTAYWICPRRGKKTNHNYFFNFVNPNTKPADRFKTYRTANLVQEYTSKFHNIIIILTWMEEAG